MRFGRNSDLANMTDDELRKIRRMSFIKMAAMIGIVVTVLAFGSIAWFTMNREVEGAGFDGKTVGFPYDITTLDNGSNGIFWDLHQQVADDSVIPWQVTAQEHMYNYQDGLDAGVKPGKSGVLSFYVKPYSDSVTLDLSFELIGYGAAENDNEDEDVTLTSINEETQRFLNTHILLFQNRTEVTDPETNVVTYVYSDPILSGEDGVKAVRNRTFTKSAENQPVNIYWVWPRTLSTLVDASVNENVNTVPFCSGTDYTAIVNHIIANPTSYFYGYTPPVSYDEEDDEAGTGVTVDLTEQILAVQYNTYGEFYDQADNRIGMNVRYITLKMETKESSGS